MSDRIFYPIFAILIAAAIYIAINPFWIDKPDPFDPADGIALEGPALQSAFYPYPGTAVTYANDVEDGSLYAVGTALLGWDEVKNAGLAVALGSDFEAAFAGKTLRISVTARKGQVDPAETLHFGYFTLEAGDSGWQSFDLTDTFEAYSFDYYARYNPRQEPASDYLGIWPDPEGLKRTVDIKKVEIKILGDGPL